jgi:hypothetical protein
MGMHNYPAFGHVIEVTPKNIRKFDLGQPGKDFIKLMEGEDGLHGVLSDESHLPFCEAFEKKYGLCPTIEYVNEEADGCDGVEPCHFYFAFCDEDKYTKVIRPEWESLPIKPEEARWTVFA